MLFSPHPSSASVRDLCLSLGRLMKAGIGLEESMGSISDTCDRKTRDLLEELVARVRRGASLADAMAAFPRSFDRAAVARVNAGETIGNAHEALEEVAGSIDRRIQARAQLIRRCIYPGMLVMAHIILAPLPLLVSGPPSAYLLAVLKDLFILGLILAAVFAGLPAICRQPAVLATLNRVAWASPWPGTVYRHHIRSVFCRLLSSHLEAGLALPHSVQSAADATGDDVLKERGGKALRAITDGSGLADALIRADLLPPKDGMLLESGERSGNAPRSLAALGISYEERAQRGLMSVVAVVGVFIGLMVMAYIALSILDAFDTVMSGTDQIMDTIQNESGLEHR